MSTLVTQCAYDIQWQADLCRARLEEEGIKAVVTEQRAGSINFFWNIATGGIKVQVLDEDYNRACEVVRATSISATNSRWLVRRFVIACLLLITIVFVSMMLMT